MLSNDYQRVMWEWRLQRHIAHRIVYRFLHRRQQIPIERGEGRKEKGERRKEKGEGRREKGEGRRERGKGRRY